MTRESSPLTGFCGFSALLSLLGAWIARGAAVLKVADDPTIPQNTDFYQYTFVRFEPFALYASAAFFLGLYLVLRRQRAPSSKPAAIFNLKSLPMIVALGVLMVACM